MNQPIPQPVDSTETPEVTLNWGPFEGDNLDYLQDALEATGFAHAAVTEHKGKSSGVVLRGTDTTGVALEVSIGLSPSGEHLFWGANMATGMEVFYGKNTIAMEGGNGYHAFESADGLEAALQRIREVATEKRAFGFDWLRKTGKLHMVVRAQVATVSSATAEERQDS